MRRGLLPIIYYASRWGLSVCIPLMCRFLILTIWENVRIEETVVGWRNLLRMKTFWRLTIPVTPSTSIGNEAPMPLRASSHPGSPSCSAHTWSRGGGGTRPENWWGCAAGRWKLDPKRSRKKLNLGPKRSIFVKIGSFCTPKDSFAVGGWEKVPQKDRARSCQSEKRGSKPRHICITHHIGSTPPPPGTWSSYLGPVSIISEKTSFGKIS